MPSRPWGAASALYPPLLPFPAPARRSARVLLSDPEHRGLGDHQTQLSPLLVREGAQPVTQPGTSLDGPSDPLHPGDDLRAAAGSRQRCPRRRRQRQRVRT